MKLSGIFRINKGRFILIFLMIIFAAVIDTLSQYLMTPAFNNLKNLNFLGFVAFMVLSILCDICRLLLNSGSDYLYSKQSQSYLHQIRKKISLYLFKKQIDDTASIQNNLAANLDQLTRNYLTPIKAAFLYGLMVIFSIVVLFSYNWSLVLLTLILTLVSLLLPKAFENMSSNATIEVTKSNEKLLKVISNWINGLDELRRYNSFRIYSGSMNQAADAYKKAAIHQGATIAIADLATSIVNIGGQIILMILAAYLYFNGQIVFGAVITTIQFCSTVMNGTALLAAQWNLIKSSKKLNEEITSLEGASAPLQNEHQDKKVAKLQIKNLQHQFKNGELISYPDLTIKSGEKVLVTGDSGSGKSTLFKLILGKLSPTSGKVIFEDKNGKEIKLNPDELGYVAQDNILFPDSIGNNMTMFNSNLDKKVKRVVKQVEFENDLKKIPDGLKHEINLDEGNLSGGQKQKIVLARAILAGSKWLFIDEGTSAIDSKATKKILENLLNQETTIVMIAHNFNNELENLFDRKISLKNGGD